jgi:hypothetical protein
VQSIIDAFFGLVLSIAWVLLGPTIVLLLLKKFVPIVGDQLWHGYCQLLAWLVVAPIRLVRLLVREALGRRHR